ncbi:MAG TPA: ABC transporter permease [Planctomycetaceae bacterium]|nr:ABC transporter permease [Planctomycetaceae bacterium]
MPDISKKTSEYGAEEITDLVKLSRRPTLLENIQQYVEEIGDVFASRVIYVGDFTSFAGNVFYWMGVKTVRRDALARAFYQIGVLSLPVVMLTGMFIGMVLAVQCHAQFKAIGMAERLGGAINLSLVRELGPVLAAVMLAGRVGCSIAAELGTMRVTEQIDALTSMGTNPIWYLVVPRFLGCLLLIPALTVMADVMGIYGGAYYCVHVLGIESGPYWENSYHFVGGFDIFTGIFKSLFFGAAIALIACHQGFRCDAGAEGVGKAATVSFVASFVMILFIDLILGIVLERVNQMLGNVPGIV